MKKKRFREEAFVGEVVPRFQFLIDKYRFRLAMAEAPYVEYLAEPWRVSVVLDIRNRTVDTYLRYDDGDMVFGAPLAHLVLQSRKKGLGKLGNSAQTRMGMISSVASQADVLKRFLPFLLSEEGFSLMRRVGDSR